MQNQEKFSLLRSILRTLGLSADAVDYIIDRIVDFLSDNKNQTSSPVSYPYRMREDFLSRAEHSFFLVLQSSVSGWAIICPKVGLHELFYAKTQDPSEFRICTNKIDRKHVDFVLCDPKTMRPLLGIELDDRSHQRDDRQERDAFVDRVFQAAGVPLVRFPVRQAYSVSELTAAIRPRISGSDLDSNPIPAVRQDDAPKCPKCGGQMLLRTAKAGPNAGKKFWGCSNYPRCHGILEYQTQEQV